ncbi:redox-regulated ATPase YchF [Candidatus Lokiarchaeum ossiferum]|uniref:redox-regulated ATPase YchF n=1 Tax=Candidatus Lokiarchaeum ossiferum TaxID=2951803 RepID=UPI00352C8DD3
MLIGIVGKPSSGKSTFLNAACLTNAKTANYPFTTIKPNVGKSAIRVKCVCKEFSVDDNPKNSQCINGERFIPIKLLDVAGLVPDAHLNKGRGNQFLSDLSRADVLIHVIDISGSLNAEGQDVKKGSHNPMDDVLFLEKEINYWFREIITRKDWGKFVRKIEQEKLSFLEMLLERLSGISIKKEHIIKAMQELNLDFEHLTMWSDEDILNFASKLRQVSKPILIVANKIDTPYSAKIYDNLKTQLKQRIIPCSALAEYWLRQFEQRNVIEYLPGDNSFKITNPDLITPTEIKSLEEIQNKILDKYEGTGVQKVLNSAVLEVLDNIVAYPVYDLHNFSDKDGNVFPDAYIVQNGTKLKEFVNDKIHSDLAKNFIYGINGRTKMRLGENYELQNNDVIKIVSAAKSK